MNICPVCSYKVISNKKFEEHKLTHEAPVEEVKEVVEPVVEAPVSDVITIRFMKSIEVRINGIPYEGKEIKVKDMQIASEIVRIAREAYGPAILA